MHTKINLGCGPVGKDDWINLDWGILAILHRYPLIERFLLALNLFPDGYNVRWPKNLKLHNCAKKLPFPDNSVDFIYTSHFLEHNEKYKALRILKDCYKTLKKGGVIRVVVPDLEILAKKYVEKDEEFFASVERLMTFDKKSHNGKRSAIMGDVFLGSFYPSSHKNRVKGIEKLLGFFVRPHLWMYDYDSFKDLMAQ